jgi:hypothetical protein
MAEPVAGLDPTVLPSGPGCTACEETGGWWFHLRRCAQCGQIGCCDSSPSQHASAHAAATGHPIIRSYEPGEDWFWDYRRERAPLGPPLAPPEHHPSTSRCPARSGGCPLTGSTNCTNAPLCVHAHDVLGELGNAARLPREADSASTWLIRTGVHYDGCTLVAARTVRTPARCATAQWIS